MNEDGTDITEVPLTPERLAGLIRLVDSGTISGPIAKEVFEKMYASAQSASEIVEREGLARIDDESAVTTAVRAVIDAHAGPVAQYRAGKQQTFGFLVGQVMKATKGKANPALVNDVLRNGVSSQAELMEVVGRWKQLTLIRVAIWSFEWLLMMWYFAAIAVRKVEPR